MLPIKSLFVAAIVALIVLPVREASAQDKYDWVAKLTASDGMRDSGLGQTLAASGDTVVMGEDCLQFSSDCSSVAQAAYVYQKPASGWGNMVQIAKLTPSDGFPGDRFGSASVAISGDTIVVGAISKAYVYVKPASGWRDMTETAQLLVPPSVIPPGFNGLDPLSASIDQDTIVVGDPFATVGGVADAGAAFVFEKPSAGWETTGKYAAELTPSNERSSFFCDPDSGQWRNDRRVGPERAQ